MMRGAGAWASVAHVALRNALGIEREHALLPRRIERDPLHRPGPDCVGGARLGSRRRSPCAPEYRRSEQRDRARNRPHGTVGHHGRSRLVARPPRCGKNRPVRAQ